MTSYERFRWIYRPGHRSEAPTWPNTIVAARPVAGHVARRRRTGRPRGLAACGSGDKASGGGTVNKSVTFGSNYSDDVPKKAFAETLAAFDQSKGFTTKINTVDHNSFQENITRYLQGNPDDAFNWFAGFRMRFFAAQGLATPIDDVWDSIGANYSDAFKKASTGEDGKKYFVPFYNYPWALFYRKSLWQAKGYQVPKTIDELRTLGAKMKTDGLSPIAFADKDGWPAMGTFDQLNMRLNGYDFHINLMAYKESWTDPKVKGVFDLWKGLLPLHQAGANGRTWQEAAQDLGAKKSGMYLLGSFVGAAVQGRRPGRPRLLRVPRGRLHVGAGRGRGADRRLHDLQEGQELAGAKEVLKYLATAEAQNIYLKSDPSDVGANSQGRRQRLQRPAEEGGRVHRRRPSRSRSSSTATPTRRSRRP